MLMEFESTVSRGLQVHVPSAVAKHLGVDMGDKILWIVEDGEVKVKKKEV